MSMSRWTPFQDRRAALPEEPLAMVRKLSMEYLQKIAGKPEKARRHAVIGRKDENGTKISRRC